MCVHSHTQRILQASKLPCLQRAGEVGVCVPTSRQPDWPVLGAHNKQTETLSPGRQVEATGGTRGCISYSMGSPAFTSISCLAHGVVSEYFHDSDHPAQYHLSPEVSPFCVQLRSLRWRQLRVVPIPENERNASTAQRAQGCGVTLSKSLHFPGFM